MLTIFSLLYFAATLQTIHRIKFDSFIKVNYIPFFMQSKKRIRQLIFQIIDNQIRDENPPETKQTFNRLVKMGYSNMDAKKYIGQCVAVEIFNITKHHQPFDKERYLQNLSKLPEAPFE
jgi:hypothetical protein